MTRYVAGLWRYPAMTLAGEGLPAEAALVGAEPS